MARRTATVSNGVGLRTRYAEYFVDTAVESPGPVTIGRVGDRRRVDAKSILLVLDLELDDGEEVELEAEDDSVLDDLVARLRAEKA